MRPPQQARSRAALQRLLTSAEHVLVNEGLEEFTIARVAEHAGYPLEGTKRRESLHRDGWHDMHLHARLAGDPQPALAGRMP